MEFGKNANQKDQRTRRLFEWLKTRCEVHKIKESISGIVKKNETLYERALYVPSQHIGLPDHIYIKSFHQYDSIKRLMKI